MKGLVIAALMMGLAACGGSSGTSDAVADSERAADSVPLDEAADRLEAAQEQEEELQHVYYQVFWREIHILTVYQTPGPLRSEEPRNPAAGLSGTSDYMSAVSHYFEHENEIARYIAGASSLEELFADLAANEDYDVREAYLEEGY